jgi:hypothetical protein
MEKSANSPPLSLNEVFQLVLVGISGLLLIFAAIAGRWIPHGLIHLTYALTMLFFASLIEGIAIFRTYHHLSSPLSSRILCAFATLSGALAIVTTVLLNLLSAL